MNQSGWAYITNGIIAELILYDFSQLSIQDSGQVLLLLPDNPPLKPIRAQLVKKLVMTVSKWSQTADLTELVTNLLALRQADKASVSGEMMARLTHILLEAEQAVGGPYRSKNGAVELLPNLLIALFLQSENVSLPAVINFIEINLPQKIDTTEQAYCLYLASQLSQPQLRGQIEKAVMRPDTVHKFDENTAWLASSLYLIGQRAKALDMINQSLKKPRIVAPGTVGKLQKLVAWLACLNYYQTHSPRHQSPTAKLSSQVYDKVRLEVSKFDMSIQLRALEVLQNIEKRDTTHEISAMANLFVDTLKTKIVPAGSAQLISGVANVYCWLAYTIYDDLLDGEATAEDLPLANLAMRRSVDRYQQILPANQRWQRLVGYAFDQMDLANAWELNHCRVDAQKSTRSSTVLPSYGRLMVLARRAGGHTLGVVSLALLVGATSIQLTHLQRGLNHFLIARQLNDDIHDWYQDLQTGQLSYVVTSMMQTTGISAGQYTISQTTSKLQDYFWKEGHQQFCLQITKHIEQARQQFKKTNLLEASGPFLDLINSVEHSALAGLNIHNKQKTFLNAYRQN